MEGKRNFYDLEEIKNDVFDGRISRAFVYALAQQGKFRTVRLGRKILVPASEVDRLLAEGAGK